MPRGRSEERLATLRFDAATLRFDAVDRRLDAVDQRFDAIGTTLSEVVRRRPERS